MADTPSHSSPTSFWLRPLGTNLILIVLAVLTLVPAISNLPLMDRDEPKFAQATQEMIDRDDWLVPWFNDEYRFDKPPLSYWWMRLHYTFLGKTELAARLHSVEASLLSAMVIAALGRFLFGPRAGLLAGVGWLTTLQILVHSRLCVADMPMILAVCVTGYALARLLLAPEDDPIANKRWNRWWWLLVGAAVFGFLAKGPIPLVTAGLGLALTRFVFGKGRPLPWRRLQPISFSVLYLVGIGLWGIPALLETQGLFWDKGMGEHVVKRGTESFNGRISVPGFYFVTAFLSLLPWCTLIPAALKRDTPEEGRLTGRSAKSAFLLGWLAAPYLVFTFYSTQLPHYVMPGFPAFFLLLFRSGSVPVPSTRFEKNWAIAVTAVIALLAGGVLWLANWAPFEGQTAGISQLITVAGILLAVAAVACFFAQRGWVIATAIAVIGTSALAWQMSEQIRAIHPTMLAMEKLKMAPEGTTYVAAEFKEPSLVFYTDKGWKMKSKNEDAVKFLRGSRITGTKNPRPRGGVMLLREWTANGVIKQLQGGKTIDELEPSSDRRAETLSLVRARLPLHEMKLYVVTGYNAAKTSWAEVLVCVPVEPRAEAKNEG
ncbi:ArnT family glycosyltransferase [Sulfuriroseicoccus oceanibius]|uniref:Glycosyltransferase family 39 protein n=1 Tax=Sulfuriroseicoccus oceanibius TaxID=2707525 RepID=A0A6B3LAZ2_9BACT|nr:glycosyltransferase family 39 protein [Sulfuriroseicoccus oceanibius]QQL45321.1 glycosyltransferase family 39 protein [Sulfuriroseicoccus oceanibius]